MESYAQKQCEQTGRAIGREKQGNRDASAHAGQANNRFFYRHYLVRIDFVYRTYPEVDCIMSIYQCFVSGTPVPKGSARAFWNKHAKKIIVQQTNRDRQRPWASAITDAVLNLGMEHQVDAPVFIAMTFVFSRPKKHFRGKAMILRDDAPSVHVVKPDIDKLIRCVLDAMTGVVFRDDCQAQIIEATKVYGDKPGCLITIKLTL
jgi:Holliday junction resolvase RusA-like endonuclease